MRARHQHGRGQLRSLATAVVIASVLGAGGTVTALARTSGPPVAKPAVPVGSQDWPTYLHDTARSDASGESLLTTTNVPYLAPKWTYTTGGIIAAEPVVSAGVEYVGSWDGYEYALNASTGGVIWKTSLGTISDPVCVPPNMGITSSATVYATPSINGGNPVVYVGGANDSNNNEQWYALDAATGNVLWSVPTGIGTQSGGDYNWSSPLIITDPADGNPYAYIGVASVCDAPLIQGEILKVSLTTHQVVAVADMVPNGQVGGGIWTSPTYDPATNRIFVSTGTLNLYSQTLSQAVVAVNATTMQVVDHWQLPFEAAVSDSDWGTTPTLTTDASGDQLLSLANKNGVLYTLNRNNLAAGPIWQKQLAYGGDCPTCGDGSISSGAFANGTLYYAAGSVSDSNGVGHGGSVTAFNPGTGAVLWTHYLNAPPLGSIVYDNGMLFYGNGQYEEALNASNGYDIWDYNLGSGTYGAASVSEGMLYQGSLSGKLFTFAPPAKLPAGPPADPNCPSGFTCQDLGGGSGRIAGSESVSGNTVSVTASGNWRAAGDAMRFISEPASGDFQVTTEDLSETPGPQCNNLPSGDNSCYSQPQVGIVIRQSFQPGSPFYVALQDPTYPAEGENQANVIIYYKDTWNGPIVELTQNYPLAFPRYLMVQRHSDTFETFFSSDDVHWTLVSGTIHTIPMPTTLMVGEGVASFMSTQTVTATYTNFAVSAPTAGYIEQNEPHACPAPWKCTDVGAGSPIGDQTVANGVWTVPSGGEGINNVKDGLGTNRTDDQFHFIYQPMPGDGTITARLVSLANPATTDQASLVMRTDVSEPSAFYGVVVTPTTTSAKGTATSATATVEWRLYNGIQQRFTLSVGTISFPTWFQINRYTDTAHSPTTTYYSLLTSSNGTSWSEVNGSTVALNLGAHPLAGFGGSTANPKTSNTSVWDNLAISGTAQQPPGVCAPTYSCTDVGNGYAAGGQEYSNGTWEFSAGGADIWDVFDMFHFVYQPMNQDGTVSAQVTAAGPANYDDEWEKAGVMLRASTDPQTTYYGVFITPQHGLAVQWRNGEAQQTNQILLSNAPTYPVYLMASRWTDPHQGGLTYFTGYYSTDNKTFTAIPGSTVALPLTGQILAGMAADSYNEKTTLAVTFNNFALFDGTENPPPGACPTSITGGCADIGGAQPAGGQSLSGTTLSVTAGGGDIWNASDQFHYVWDTLSGDGAVSADVASQQNTGPWAKAGVMVRGTAGSGGALDASAPYYAVFATPSNGIAVQWRSAEGGLTSQLLASGTVPVYLEVTRYTDSGGNQNFSAFTSSDGVNWTWIPGSTQQLPITGTVAAGWAADSYSQTVSAQVTFSNISVTSGTQQPVGVCPASWTCSDIGGATPSGAQTASGSTWSVYGGGGDIWSTSDQFHFVEQTMNSDGTLSADLTSQQNTNGWAKAGLMMRSTSAGANDPQAAYYAVLTTPSNGTVVQWRAGEGAATNQITAGGGAPQWLQLQRWTDTSGTTPVTYYYALTSADGNTWTVVPGSVQALNLGSSFQAGVAVSSHDTSHLGGVTLTNVGIGTTSSEPPGVCLQAYTCADIGGATPAGTQSTSNGVWTVQAGGGDIWGTSDQFRYIWTAMPGDGTASLRVASLQETDPWAKAGVMLRSMAGSGGATDPSAPYYAVFDTGGNGLDVQYRATESGATAQILLSGVTAPVYVAVVRADGGATGTTFTAQYSTDGVTWTTISGSAVNIPALSGTLAAGMAATSHNQSTLTSVSFDNLNLP